MPDRWKNTARAIVENAVMTRDELINAIDSPIVQALARVFDTPPQRMDKSFSEQIVEILAPKLINVRAQRAPKPSAWRACWVSLNTSRTQLFEIEAEANAKARETGGCVIPLYTTPAQQTLIPAGKQAKFKGEAGGWFGVYDWHDQPETFEYRTVYALTSTDGGGKA